jgi:hypothetical protein
MNKKIYSDDMIQIGVFQKDLCNTGLELIDEFYNVGCEARKLKMNSFKNPQNTDLIHLINDASKLIVKTTTWIHEFLCIYPDVCLTVDESEYDDKNACIARSGLQFMFDLFNGVNNEIDKSLKYLHDETIQDIDWKMSYAKKYCNTKVKREDLPSSIPHNHSWWLN